MRGVRNRCVRKLDRFLKTTLCPVCNKHRFGVDEDYYICPVCGWENDLVQNENHDYAGGANQLSVNQAREAFRRGEGF